MIHWRHMKNKLTIWSNCHHCSHQPKLPWLATSLSSSHPLLLLDSWVKTLQSWLDNKREKAANCYILDSPWSTLGPEPFPEDTRTTSLVTFHVLLDKPQTRTLPGLLCTMAYAKSPLFTFYYMTHSPYLCFPLSHYHWLSTRPSALPIRYIHQESNPQHSPWWSYQSNNRYWYLSSLRTCPWSKG